MHREELLVKAKFFRNFRRWIRGLVRGSVFKRDGTLVASSAQEGLIRQKKK